MQQVAQAGGNTLAFAEDIAMAPFELTSGLKLGELSDNAPFNRWAQKIREEGNAVNEYYAENIKAGGKGAEIFDRFGSSLIAAVPQAAAAVLSGGTSAVASTAGLQAQAASALSPGLTTTIRNVVGKMAANPQYWLSFSQAVGNGYENAIADMEEQSAIAQLRGGKPMDSNTIRTKAALQAIGSGLMSAAVEMSGGLQKLPEELRHGESVWKALVDSGVDEGMENVYQGIIDRASQNLFYDKGNPLVSLTDPNAVFSIPAAANEFAGGFTVGSILGGGQAGVLSAAQTMPGIFSSPVTSYSDVVRQMIAEQNTATESREAEQTDTSQYERYQELERKYLVGTISPDEADELWRLEGIGQFGALNERSSNTSEYDRYKELERKYLDGTISPDEADELWRLEDAREHPKTFAEFTENEYNDIKQWEYIEYLKRRTSFVENAPCLTTPKKFTGYFLNPEAKHAEDFFNVGYTKEDPMRLRYDIAKQFDMSKAVDFKEMPDGAIRFNIYMELGVTKKRRFLIGWIQDTPDSVPRIVTGFRKDGGRNNGE